MPEGYGPIVETIHYTGDVLVSFSAVGYTGAGHNDGHPYPAGWDSSAAVDARDEAIASQVFDSTPSVAYSYTRDNYVGAGDVTYFQYLGNYGRRVATVHAGGIPTPDIDPELPEGASFWTWDTDTYEVETALLEIQFTARLQDSSAPTEATSDASDYYVKVGNGITYATSSPYLPTAWTGGEGAVLATTPLSSPHGYSTTVDVNVLEHLVGTAYDFFAPGRLSVAAGVSADTPDPSPSALPNDIDGGFSLLGGATMILTYGIKMGYRFWYDELPEETLSVVRQFPRDDALGWGGAPRNYPPPKAQRIIGGYQ